MDYLKTTEFRFFHPNVWGTRQKKEGFKVVEFRKRVAIIAAVILMLQTAFGILAGLGTTESLAAGDNSSGQYTCRFTVKVLESPEQWTHADYVIMG